MSAVAEPDVMAELCRHLAGQQAALDALVADLLAERWDEPTPAPGWTIKDQIAHLGYFDAVAVDVIERPDDFRRQLPAILDDPERYMTEHLDLGRSSSATDVLERWRADREHMLRVFAATPARLRLPWFGPDMSARSFATARLMEVFAHGQDVADTIGATAPRTAGLQHIAHLGVITRGFAYGVRGRPLPEATVAVELRGPEGETWSWSAPTDAGRIEGPAWDFCLVVARRRHVLDTGLVVEGELAREWMEIAQIFAGDPGPGRAPGQFA